MDTSVKVILLVKTRRELYDVNHPDYGNKRHHTVVWKQLASKMGVKVQHLKAKWNSLRNSYARTIRPEILNPNAPAKSWYLKSHMDFLRPHVAHKIQRSQYLEKIRNGDIFDDDSTSIDFDETTNLGDDDDYDDEDKDEEIIVHSPGHEDNGHNGTSDDEHIEIENQPIDFLENVSQADLTTVHDFTINEDKIQEQAPPKPEANNVVIEKTSNYNLRPKKLKKYDKNTIYDVERVVKLDNDRQNYKKTKQKLKKIKKEKCKKFDQILDLLGGFCTENMGPESQVKPDSLFFQSIMSDFEKLSEKKKRKFKARVLSELNDLLDETEMENLSASRDKSN